MSAKHGGEYSQLKEEGKGEQANESKASHFLHPGTATTWRNKVAVVVGFIMLVEALISIAVTLACFSTGSGVMWPFAPLDFGSSCESNATTGGADEYVNGTSNSSISSSNSSSSSSSNSSQWDPEVVFQYEIFRVVALVSLLWGLLLLYQVCFYLTRAFFNVSLSCRASIRFRITVLDTLAICCLGVFFLMWPQDPCLTRGMRLQLATLMADTALFFLIALPFCLHLSLGRTCENPLLGGEPLDATTYSSTATSTTNTNANISTNTKATAVAVSSSSSKSSSSSSSAEGLGYQSV